MFDDRRAVKEQDFVITQNNSGFAATQGVSGTLMENLNILICLSW